MNKNTFLQVNTLEKRGSLHLRCKSMDSPTKRANTDEHTTQGFNLSVHKLGQIDQYSANEDRETDATSRLPHN